MEDLLRTKALVTGGAGFVWSWAVDLVFGFSIHAFLLTLLGGET